MRTCTLKVSHIETLHGIRNNPFLLADPSVIRCTPVLFMTAMLSSLLPFAIVYPPGALTVGSRPFPTSQQTRGQTKKKRFLEFYLFQFPPRYLKKKCDPSVEEDEPFLFSLFQTEPTLLSKGKTSIKKRGRSFIDQKKQFSLRLLVILPPSGNLFFNVSPFRYHLTSKTRVTTPKNEKTQTSIFFGFSKNYRAPKVDNLKKKIHLQDLKPSTKKTI